MMQIITFTSAVAQIGCVYASEPARRLLNEINKQKSPGLKDQILDAIKYEENKDVYTVGTAALGAGGMIGTGIVYGNKFSGMMDERIEFFHGKVAEIGENAVKVGETTEGAIINADGDIDWVNTLDQIEFDGSGDFTLIPGILLGLGFIAGAWLLTSRTYGAIQDEDCAPVLMIMQYSSFGLFCLFAITRTMSMGPMGNVTNAARDAFFQTQERIMEAENEWIHRQYRMYGFKEAPENELYTNPDDVIGIEDINLDQVSTDVLWDFSSYFLLAALLVFFLPLILGLAFAAFCGKH